MIKNLTIGIFGSGAAEALRVVEEYQKRLTDKTNELIHRLAEIGVEVARAGFEAAPYDGIKEFSVTFEDRDTNTVAVIATGRTVLFLEFGAGVYYPDSHPYANGMVHGTYGKGKGANPYWFYTGQPGTAGGELAYGHINTTITHGNPASMAMYEAHKRVKEDIVRIAREVFNN